MRYFIQIKNNTPFEHPILENNFTQAFPNLDMDNLPEEFAEFIRIPQPDMLPFQVCEGCTYERDGVFFKDVHHIRDMTETEKSDKIAEAYSNLPEGWSLNEETLQVSFKPPPKPDESGNWIFNFEQKAWVENG